MPQIVDFDTNEKTSEQDHSSRLYAVGLMIMSVPMMKCAVKLFRVPYEKSVTRYLNMVGYEKT